MAEPLTALTDPDNVQIVWDSDEVATALNQAVRAEPIGAAEAVAVAAELLARRRENWRD